MLDVILQTSVDDSLALKTKNDYKKNNNNICYLSAEF